MLNKTQTRFIGLGNFRFLLSRDVFWMVVRQTIVFACTAVFFKAFIGLVTAHLINNLPSKGQRMLRRFAAWRRGIAFHVSHPRHRSDFHSERGAQARPGDRMSATAIGIRAGKGFVFRASLRRNRRWALITSYVFLIVFAVFFLIPPYYMVVTSLKSDAEVAHMATRGSSPTGSRSLNSVCC
jgi:ABC-type sugar transport system permease subunit